LLGIFLQGASAFLHSETACGLLLLLLVVVVVVGQLMHTTGEPLHESTIQELPPQTIGMPFGFMLFASWSVID